MDKDVLITVKGTQISQMEDENNEDRPEYPNEVELVTEGKYFKEENSYYVIYNESEMTGFEGTTTTLKIADGVVVLRRSGTVNSQIVFQEGHKHISYYDTAEGAFTIGVYANKVNINIDENGGKIFIDYLLEIDEKSTIKRDFCIVIKEVKPAMNSIGANN